MKVSIIGAGSYGTAIAQLISQNAETVYLHARDKSAVKAINKRRVNPNYFPSLKLSKNIIAVQLYEDAQYLKHCDVIVFCLPSGVTRETARRLSADHIKDKLIVSTSKGIEFPSLNTMSETISSVTGNKNIICFSGPTFADELIQGFLSGFTIGTSNQKQAKIATSLLGKSNVIYDFSNDIKSVELCGVLKNIYSIAIGIFDSFSYSNNEHYAFLNLCYKEMNSIIVRVSKDKELVHKFCFFGDFNLTTNTDKSRNRTLGLMVGKGMLKLNEFNPSIVYEGMKSVRAIKKMSKRLGLNIPIVDFAHDSLNSKKNVKIEIASLLTKLCETGV